MYITGPRGMVVRQGLGCGLCAQLIRDPSEADITVGADPSESDYIRAGSSALAKAGGAVASLWDVLTGKVQAEDSAKTQPISPAVLVISAVLLAGVGYGIYRWQKGA